MMKVTKFVCVRLTLLQKVTNFSDLGYSQEFVGKGENDGYLHFFFFFFFSIFRNVSFFRDKITHLSRV